ncbi:MAG: hypothetical protein QOJ39_1650 [Candidatus Eremiobacteraeota bacterium]|nr:hypothetical protein [Candidatus Eremiobacteraeota bacterium]
MSLPDPRVLSRWARDRKNRRRAAADVTSIPDRARMMYGSFFAKWLLLSSQAPPGARTRDGSEPGATST